MEVGKSRCTRTRVRVDLVVTSGTVQTRVRGALVDIDFTVITGKPILAHTQVEVGTVKTHAVRPARIRRTLVNVNLAPRAC